MVLLLLPKSLGVLHWAKTSQGLKPFGGVGKVLPRLFSEIESTEELRSKLLTDGPNSLSAGERNNLLWDAESMIALHEELWLCSSETLDAWWQQALRHYSESTEIALRRSVNH